MSSLTTHKLGMVTNSRNPSAGEVEAQESEIQGHHQLPREFKASLGYMISSPKIKLVKIKERKTNIMFGTNRVKL